MDQRRAAIAAPDQSTPSALRDARRARGLSLGKVYRETGIDASQLSKVERGEAGLSIDALLRLAECLGLDDLTEALEPFALRRSA
jgi:transcriptional regulator with XRE-family HTH domain